MNTPSHLWNTSATVLRHVQTIVNGEAVYEQGPSETFKCRVQILSGEEALRQGGDRSKYYGKVYCTPGLDVTENDHLELIDGTEWYITAVRDPDFMHAFMTIDIDRPVVENHNGL